MDRARKIVAALLETDQFDSREWLLANDVETAQDVQRVLVGRFGFKEGPEHSYMRHDTQFAAHKVYQTPVGPLTVLMHNYYDNDDEWIHLDVREASGRQATGAGYWNMKLPADGTDIFRIVDMLDKKLTTLKDWNDIENLRVEFRGKLIGHA